MQPWTLLGSWQDYIFGWIINYSVFLSAIMGILIIDYFLRRRKLEKLPDLYRPGSEFWYNNGINMGAMLSLILGIVLGFSIRLASESAYIQYSGPFISMFVSSLLYALFYKFASIKQGTHAKQ